MILYFSNCAKNIEKNINNNSNNNNEEIDISAFLDINKEDDKDDENRLKCPTAGMSLMECLKYQIENNQLPGSEDFAPLYYCDFLNATKAITQEETRELIKLAYRYHSPIIFAKADKEILDTDYSINLLWLHNKKLTEKGHLFGKDDIKLKEVVITPVLNWRKMQPNAIINFWYDEKLVDKKAIENTKNIFKKLNIDLSAINFRDINEIDSIKKEYSNIFKENTPVYFRVDFAKAVIGDYILRNDKLPYAINSDIDVVPITKEQLFDEKAIELLDRFGHAFGVASATKENSFIILGHKILDKHKKDIIDKSAHIANMYIDDNKAEKIKEEMVFIKYIDSGLLKYGATGNFYQNEGKYMIFGESKFSVDVVPYTPEQIKILKKALLTPNGCK